MPDLRHALIPRDPLPNLLWRRKLWHACAKDKGLRAAVKEACREDALFFINSFTFTDDPRRSITKRPFATWPFQDTAVTAIIEGIKEGQKPNPEYKDSAFKKSRDLGLSWIFCATFAQQLIFVPDVKLLVISRTAEAVDSFDPDSLFWKIDYILANLPPWLRPEIIRKRGEPGDYFNVETGGSLNGAATVKAAGVGGRRTAVFVDEFSRIDVGDALISGLADVTNCRLWNFTSFGTSTAAARLFARSDVRKFLFMWWDDPRKNANLYRWSEEKGEIEYPNGGKLPDDYPFRKDGKLRSPWYDLESIRRTPQDMAIMVDANDSGADFQFFSEKDLEVIKTKYARPPLLEGDVVAEENKPVFVRKEGGKLKLWCNLDHNGRPPLDRSYVAGCDVAAGTGASDSVCAIYDCKTGEKVAEYVNCKIYPDPFADKVFWLLHLFTNHRQDVQPKVIWEHFGPGVSFGGKLIDLGYSRLYVRRNEDQLGKPISGERPTPGWNPNPRNKARLLNAYKQAIIDGEITERSAECLDECKQYVFKNDGWVYAAKELDDHDPSGARANHGDRVMASAMAAKLYLDEWGGGNQPAEERGVEIPPPNTLAGRRAEAGRSRRGFWS